MVWAMAAAKRKRKPKAKRNRKTRSFSRSELALFDQMLEAGATQAELAKALGTSPATLKRRFGEQLKGRHPRGRRCQSWTEPERALVSIAAGTGIPQAELAVAVGLSTAEFQAAFSEDLKGAKAKVDQAVAGAIIAQGLAGDGNLLRFYARAKMGWNDKSIPDTPPPDRDATDALRLAISKLDPDGRKAYRLVLKQMGTSSPLTDDGPGPGERLQ